VLSLNTQSFFAVVPGPFRTVLFFPTKAFLGELDLLRGRRAIYILTVHDGVAERAGFLSKQNAEEESHDASFQDGYAPLPPKTNLAKLVPRRTSCFSS